MTDFTYIDNVELVLDDCFKYLWECGKINVSEEDFTYIRNYIFKEFDDLRNGEFNIDTDIFLEGE